MSWMKKHMKAALVCGMLLMPLSAFRPGFTNGLMSESMILWFGVMLIRESRRAAA